MTATNSLNDRLIVHQNVEINSNEYFSYDVFSGMKSSNEIVNHVERKRHCAMTKEVQRYFKYQ